MPLPVNIQKVTPADTAQLLQLSRKTFYDAFEKVNNPDDFKAYTSTAFTNEQLLSEIKNPDSAFYFAVSGNEVAGYIKLNYNTAQAEFQHNDAVEISRLYVSADHQRKQIGQQLIDFAINKAISDRLTYIWLGVWEHNYDAQRFYERNGFKPIGSHVFMVGKDAQVDILMRKSLTEATS